jgi:hypothetical protein
MGTFQTPTNDALVFVTAERAGKWGPGVPLTSAIRATTICSITLRAAKGSCTLTASQLRPGTYQLKASYPGSSSYSGSASPARKLTITR